MITILVAAFSLIGQVAVAAPRTICIDPGHPSEVGRGTAGRSISEISLAWQIAVGLRRELTASGY